MKKCVFSFLFFFFIFACHAFAGSTSLTTYYPAPTAAYNKVKLSTTTAPSCIAANSCPNGTLYTDNNGNLNVFMNGQSTPYPQQCFNSFCSYNTTTGVTNCTPSACAFSSLSPGATTCLPTCPAGFYMLQTGATAATRYADEFQISPTGWIISIACCSFQSCGPLGTNETACPGTPLPTSAQTYTVVGNSVATCAGNVVCSAYCTNGDAPVGNTCP